MLFRSEKGEKPDQAALRAAKTEYGYTTLPWWNSREQLGQRVATKMNNADGAKNAVHHLFRRLAGEITGVLIAVEKGEITDPDWHWQIDASIEFITGLLLGYAPEPEP